jgi:hypothetical protein
MEALRGAAVAGEGKAVRKDPVPNRARLAARREALIRRLGKTADGELTGRAHGGPGRIVHGVHAACNRLSSEGRMSPQGTPRLTAKFSVKARLWHTSFSSYIRRGKERMYAGKAGAGSSSSMNGSP